MKLLVAQLGHDPLHLLMPNPYDGVDFHMTGRLTSRRLVEPDPAKYSFCDASGKDHAGPLLEAKVQHGPNNRLNARGCHH